MKWQSPDFTANKRWQAEMKAFNKAFPNYPFKPPSRMVYQAEFKKYMEAKNELRQKKEASKLEWQRFSGREVKPFDQKVFKQGGPCPRGPVLSDRTIWFPMEWYPDFDPIAPWPPLEHMKYEGDDRVNSKSGRSFGRFLALPRLPSDNPTVNWTMWRVLPHLPFDEIWRVPTAEDVCAPVEEIEDWKVLDLLNMEMLKAIEEAASSSC